MKSVHSVLSHLTHQPQFKSLQKHKCYRKFLSLLSPRYQQAIAFVYLRSETLYIALSHPGYRLELHYNRDSLKSVLSMVGEHYPECVFLQAKEIVIFVSKYRQPETAER